MYQMRKRMLEKLFIDIFAMSYTDYFYSEYFGIDGIDNPVIANTEPVAVFGPG